MYNKKAIARHIRSIGPIAFMNYISSHTLPDNLVRGLEKFHILVNGVPCKEEIFRLAC